MKGNFVYFLYNTDKVLLYIGKTVALRARLTTHFCTTSVIDWKKDVDRENIMIFPCLNGCDLDVYETYFINRYKPLHNKDKVFEACLSFEPPYIEPRTYNFNEHLIDRNHLLQDIKRYTFLRNLEILNNSELLEVKELLENYPDLIPPIVDKLGIQKVISLGNSFKDLISTLQTVYLSENEETFLIIEYIFALYPWFSNLVAVKGFEAAFQLVIDEKYQLTNLIRKASAYVDKNTLKKLQNLLKPHLIPQSFISSQQLKSLLKDIYSNLHIKLTPKSTDIKDIYKLEEKIKYIEGKTVRGYLVLEETLLN